LQLINKLPANSKDAGFFTSFRMTPLPAFAPHPKLLKGDSQGRLRSYNSCYKEKSFVFVF